jgi:hypothetical protein
LKNVNNVAAPQAVIESNAGKVSLNDNLFHLMLIPKDDAGNTIIKGKELFDHRCRFRNMKHTAAKGKGLDNDEVSWMEPSEGLDIHLEMDSLKMIQPTPYDLRQGAILKDYIGNNALCRTAKSKLNNITLTVGNCGVINSKENMRRLREQLIMADSVAEISRLEADEKMIEKLAKNKVHDEKAPAAATKLEGKGRDANKLTVKEIEAILCKVYSITLGGSHRKIDHVKALENEMASSIGKYEDYLRLLADDNAATVPPALAAIEDVCTAEIEEEVEELALNAIGNV